MKKEYENYKFQVFALYVECNGDNVDKESLYALSLKQTHIAFYLLGGFKIQRKS